MAHDVYISYSTEDAHIANLVCNKLETDGVRCWMAPRDIEPGEITGSAIVGAIGSAKIFLLIFSGNSNRSGNVLKEIEIASNSGVLILPYKIDSSSPVEALHYYLASIHWIDAVDSDMEQSAERLRSYVRGLLGVIPSREGGSAAGREQLLKEDGVKTGRGKFRRIAFPAAIAALFVVLSAFFGFEAREDMSTKVQTAASLFPTAATAETPDYALSPDYGLDVRFEVSMDGQLIDHLKLVYDDGAVDNYQASTFILNYFDKLFSLDVIAFDGNNKVLGKLKIENAYVVDKADVSSIPPGATTVIFLREASQRDFGQVCTRKNLRELALLRGGEVADLSAIGNLTRLKCLMLRDLCFAKDLTPLTKLPQIDSLSIWGLSASPDYRPLTAIKELRALEISDDKMQALCDFSALKNLASLRLSDCNALQDIKALSGLKGLKTLRLYRCNAVEDYSPLAGLTQLASLDLSFSSHLDDLSILSGMKDLTTLVLDDSCDLANIGAIAGLTKLRSFSATFCDGLLDVSPLASLKSLERLDLSNCKSIRDIGALSVLTDLKRLNLNGCNAIADDSPLKSLRNTTINR